MRCPYRKTVIHQNQEEHELYIVLPRYMEEYCECYREECPYYEEHNVCKKVKAEVGLIDG